MKHLKVWLLIGGLFASLSVGAQNEKFKALFIYNFTNYIEWPGQGSVFVISVVGDSPIIDELNTIAKIKKVGTATIQVKKINSPAEASDAQVVFIPAGKKKVVTEFAPVLKNSNTLIITDDASGGFGINFVEVDQKQSFQISKTNIESHKLKVNSSLIALGIPVN